MIVTVVIDVFRAFTTAAFALDKGPSEYFLTNRCDTVRKLASAYQNPLLIGKPEKGSSLVYDIPNSPTRINELDITNRVVIHRTEAGAKGILEAAGSDLIFGVGFVNADATAKILLETKRENTLILPMGHEGVTPSLEDDLCAAYVSSLLDGKSFNLTPHRSVLKAGAGRYFFDEDQAQYPQEDFDLCLTTKQFIHGIQAEVREDYASLTLMSSHPAQVAPLKGCESPSPSI